MTDDRKADPKPAAAGAFAPTEAELEAFLSESVPPSHFPGLDPLDPATRQRVMSADFPFPSRPEPENIDVTAIDDDVRRTVTVRYRRVPK